MKKYIKNKYAIAALASITLIVAIIIGIKAPDMVRTYNHNKIVNKIQSKYNVQRDYSGRAWGTYWKYWGGWLTADHVDKANLGETPYYVKGDACRTDIIVDATGYGIKLPRKAPLKPTANQSVYVVGYPSGSEHASMRIAKVYLKRKPDVSTYYTTPSWIAIIQNPPEKSRLSRMFAKYEPVVPGMSGGVVVDKEFNAIGLLVAQNSAADVNGDQIPDDSFDFISLHDIYSVFSDKHC